MTNGILVVTLGLVLVAAWRHWGPLDAITLTSLVYLFSHHKFEW